MEQRDWFNWLVDISQIIGAISTAAAGMFAALALQVNKRDREERDRPFLAARRGEYTEAPIPDNVDHPSFNLLQTNPRYKVAAVLVNVGNGPLVDLSIQLGFRLENDLDEVLAQKPPGGFLGEGVIAVGE